MEIYDGDYVVYIHINKENGKKYVGITRQNPPNKRWQNGNGYRHNLHFYNAIKKYGWKNFYHEIVASNLTREEACNFERLLIKKLNTTNRECGYNHGAGGETNENRVVSEETKQKISKANKGRTVPQHVRDRISQSEKGRVFSEEHKKKISDALKGEKCYWYGKTQSQEAREKMSKSRKGKTQSLEHKINRLASLHQYHLNEIKPIKKYSLNGELIAIYRNVLYAAEDIIKEGKTKVENKSVRANIKLSANNEGKTAYGYIWRWSSDEYKFDEYGGVAL